MGVINRVFRNTTDGSIASYDYVDYLENLGYITYYAVNHTDYKKLMKNAIASQIPLVSFSVASDVYAFGSNINWDLDFNTPAVIGGADIIVSGTIDRIDANGGNSIVQTNIVISKVDAGGVVTSLCQASGAIVTIGNSALGARHVVKAALPVTTMEIGSKLRVNTQIFDKNSTGSSTECYLYTDGASRGNSLKNQCHPTAGTTSLGYTNRTDIQVQVPFKLS